MSAIIEKFLNTLINQPKKLPQTMIIIFIFTSLFPREFLNIINILTQKIKIIFPKSFLYILTNLHFSQEDLLEIWAFLVVIYVLTIILTVLNQLLKGYIYITIGSGGDILFETNSIIFLGILIHNNLYYPKIKLDSIHFTAFYSFFVYCSVITFIFIFFITYINFFQLYQKINDSELSHKSKILWNIVLLIALLCIYSKIVHSLFH